MGKLFVFGAIFKVGKGVYHRVKAMQLSEEARGRITKRVELLLQLITDLESRELEELPGPATSALDDVLERIQECEKICASTSEQNKLKKFIKAHTNQSLITRLENELERAVNSANLAVNAASLVLTDRVHKTVRSESLKTQSLVQNPMAGLYMVDEDNTLKPPAKLPPPSARMDGELLVISWKDPDNNGEGLKFYEVQYSEEDLLPPIAPRYTSIKLGPPKIQPGHTYRVSVRGVNDCGPGEWSDSTLVCYQTPEKEQSDDEDMRALADDMPDNNLTTSALGNTQVTCATPSIVHNSSETVQSMLTTSKETMVAKTPQDPQPPPIENLSIKEEKNMKPAPHQPSSPPSLSAPASLQNSQLQPRSNSFSAAAVSSCHQAHGPLHQPSSSPPVDTTDLQKQHELQPRSKSFSTNVNPHQQAFGPPHHVNLNSHPIRYPPQGQGYPPQGQGYPPQGQGYPPQGQGYPPQGQRYPPQGQGYPPQGQGYPPGPHQCHVGQYSTPQTHTRPPQAQYVPAQQYTRPQHQAQRPQTTYIYLHQGSFSYSNQQPQVVPFQPGNARPLVVNQVNPQPPAVWQQMSYAQPAATPVPQPSAAPVPSLPVPGAPTELRPSSKRTNTLIKVRWKPPAINPEAVNIYVLEVHQKKAAAIPWKVVATSSPAKLSGKATDLKTSTTYQFRVYAFSAEGIQGPYSEVIEVDTKSGTITKGGLSGLNKIASSSGSFFGSSSLKGTKSSGVGNAVFGRLSRGMTNTGDYFASKVQDEELSPQSSDDEQ